MPERETPYPGERERKIEITSSRTKRIFKKRRQVGAGREVQFKKSSQEVQDELLKTRKKEWNNWVQFTAARVLPPEEQPKFFAEYPETEIIPTRWMDTNKSEEGRRRSTRVDWLLEAI